MTEATDRARRDVQEALRSGDHIFSSLGMTDVHVEDVDLAVEMPVTPRLSNSRGGLQGGLIATLVDVVAGRLAMDGARPGHSSATNDLSIHFLAPIVEGPARAEGKVLRRGQRSVVVHVEVRDLATDRLAAVSTISFTVLAPLPG
ncbi:MAG: PaaI family thioesterase [Acidimicrobiales bacterium]